MKVNPTSKLSYDTNLSKNNLLLQTPSMTENMTKDSVSFGSKNILTKCAETLVDGNFLVNFLVVDALSMIIPRILIGLGRDKDKTGKINYKAGAEEAGRELLSGPSMMFIPMGILAVYRHFSPASHMERNTLDAFTHSMSKVIEKTKDKEQINKNLADKLFDGAFEDFNLDGKDELKTKFSELLNKSTSIEKKMFKNKEFNNTANEFEKLVALINNSIKNKAPDNSKIISLDTGVFDKKENKKIFTEIKAKDLFEDFRNYSKDIITKFKEKSFASSTDALHEIEKMKVKSNIVKMATGITGFLAVGAFLLRLPKIYQVSKISPAMDSANRAMKEASSGGTNENS